MSTKSKKSLTPNQEEFMGVIHMYNDIADNGNLMMELGWKRGKVASVGRGLIRKGLVEYRRIDVPGFEGGNYRLTKTKRIKKV